MTLEVGMWGGQDTAAGAAFGVWPTAWWVPASVFASTLLCAVVGSRLRRAGRAHMMRAEADAQREELDLLAPKDAPTPSKSTKRPAKRAT